LHPIVSISDKDVTRVAELARLKITDDQIANYRTGLSEILGLVKQMDECDTEGVAPMAHPQDIALRLREDAVTEQDEREALQASAPRVEDGLYLVPRVID
jgi:aspartyl-tRNA(Asn)/glutamyl-tRNA(Gln) amidotransferase subunit C